MIYAVRVSGEFWSSVVFEGSLRSCLVRTSSTHCVLRLRLRGLFGRSFLHATVPQPVPSWTPADRLLRPRSGAIRPTPIKSVRPSCGTPRRSIIRNTPGPRTRSRGHIELAWSRRDSLAKAANQHRHKSRIHFSHHAVVDSTLQEPGRRIGGHHAQHGHGNRPERRARARRGMRVDRSVHPCSFGPPPIPL